MMDLVPITLTQANEFVERHHRHSPPIGVWKYGMGVVSEGRLVGVAIVTRPASIHYDDGETLEVARCCTDGTKNACSKLYAACIRVAVTLGYRRVITWTLVEEPGSSLRAVKFKELHCTQRVRQEWHGRPANESLPRGQKRLWAWEQEQRRTGILWDF